jgi:hypothetical protein
VLALYQVLTDYDSTYGNPAHEQEILPYETYWLFVLRELKIPVEKKLDE